MGDVGEHYNAMRDLKRRQRLKHGVQCPRCIEEQPRRQPTILMPGDRCRVHSPPYVDPRTPLTDEEYYDG